MDTARHSLVQGLVTKFVDKLGLHTNFVSN